MKRPKRVIGPVQLLSYKQKGIKVILQKAHIFDDEDCVVLAWKPIKELSKTFNDAREAFSYIADHYNRNKALDYIVTKGKSSDEVVIVSAQVRCPESKLGEAYRQLVDYYNEF